MRCSRCSGVAAYWSPRLEAVRPTASAKRMRAVAATARRRWKASPPSRRPGRDETGSARCSGGAFRSRASTISAIGSQIVRRTTLRPRSSRSSRIRVPSRTDRGTRLLRHMRRDAAPHARLEGEAAIGDRAAGRATTRAPMLESGMILRVVARHRRSLCGGQRRERLMPNTNAEPASLPALPPSRGLCASRHGGLAGMTAEMPPPPAALTRSGHPPMMPGNRINSLVPTRILLRRMACRMLPITARRSHSAPFAWMCGAGRSIATGSACRWARAASIFSACWWRCAAIWSRETS